MTFPQGRTAWSRRWRFALAFLAVGLVLAGAFAVRRIPIAAAVGAGFAAKVVCSLHFLAGEDPTELMRGYVDGELGGMGFLFDIEVEATAVTARAPFGILARAVYRPGHGCTLLAGLDENDIVDVTSHRPRSGRAKTRDFGDAPGRATPAVAAAIDAAFREPENSQPGRVRATKAVVVLHRGRLVAERYAEGYGRNTPMLSWSMAKSVLAAVVGVLVADGKLRIDVPAAVPEWSQPDDPRRAITLDMLLRQSSGLEFDETYGAISDVSRMLFTRPDTAAFAAAKPLAHAPDSHWSYSSGTSNIIARLLAERFGRAPDLFATFLRARLFEPCGIDTAVFESDASGTPIGSSFVFMSALDWARFGELYRRDGVCGDAERVLPEGWVAYGTTPTAHAAQGAYGAHWWLNAGDRNDPTDRLWPRLPADAYAALGHSGQYVVVVPSAELVVVRLGLSLPDDGNDGTEELIAALLAELAPE